MPESSALTLDSVSVLLVWTAITIYALAFIAYAVDLARRGADAVDAKDAQLQVRERELVAAGGAPGRASGGELRAQEKAAEDRRSSAAVPNQRLFLRGDRFRLEERERPDVPFVMSCSLFFITCFSSSSQSRSLSSALGRISPSSSSI